MIAFVQTKQGVTAYLSTGPKVIAKDTPGFSTAVEILRKESTTEEELLEAIDVAVAINRVAVNKELTIDTNTCVAEYLGKPLNSALSKRLVEMFIKKGADGIAYLIKFLENLYQNPSYRAVTELYGFLDACDLPITEDGCFLTYKRVREDYKDIHSGTFDNSVGATCKMPRNAVDENREVTCSEGLHVCSFGYLSSFSGARTVVCKVNPRDVVAVPADYDNQKMRVCEYTVISEIPNDGSEKIESWAEGDGDDEDDRFDEIREAVIDEFEEILDIDDIDIYEDFAEELSYNAKFNMIENIGSKLDRTVEREEFEDSFTADDEFSVYSVHEFFEYL